MAAMNTLTELLSNPKALTCIQIALSGFVVGVTDSGSIWRPAFLPISATFVYYVTKSKMGGGGQSLGFLLQYIELALLKRWAYKPAVDQILPDWPTKTEKDGENVIIAKEKSESKLDQGNSWLRRTWLGISAMFSFRRVNTADEVRGVPPSPTDSRKDFCLRALGTMIWTNMGLDLIEYLRILGRTHGDFSERQMFFFTNAYRSGGIDPQQLLVRALSTFGWWFGVACLLSQMHSMVSIVAVATGISEPKAWRPLFGSIRKATSLRGLWGEFWHQMLRGPFSGVTEIAAHDIVRLPRRSGNVVARYLKVIVTFFVSGVYHVIEEQGTGAPPLHESGAMRFFLMQALGIIVEDRVRTWTKGSWLANSWLGSVCGYSWVVFWLVWTSPCRSYPNLRWHTAQVLETSLLRALGIVKF